MMLVFALAWAWAVKIDNYSLVDAVWAFGIGLTAVMWLSLGNGDAVKRCAAAVLITCWSLRLGSHLTHRIRKAHPDEDARYRKLRELWKGREKRMFFGFFQVQAASVVLLALPFLFIGRDASGFGVWEAAGAIISVLAISGEALADHQMNAFKKQGHDRKAVCDVGLWRYSRHPNYFFESLIWVGFYLFACGSAYGWMMVHAPLVILFLLLRVTGVPPSEASSLASKGDAYRAYQRRTSVFIPLPPRRPSEP
ncbi:MAG: DUF1295 domain-containing protein [Verrucomicrobiaceae bacterium]|nr:MAG: DUF1295 domain-containing protein [Verrucomicrobiaceae bacterium]